MRKPTRKRVIAAIDRDLISGKKRYIDGVQFNNGFTAVIYEVRSPVKDVENWSTHAETRLVVIDPTGHRTTSDILESKFER